MNATTLNGSVVDALENVKRAIAADSGFYSPSGHPCVPDLTLLPYSHQRSLAVDLLLWHEELTWQERTWQVLNGWKGVES